jgi:hypothetical protein
MIIHNLDFARFWELLHTVFAVADKEHELTIFVDLPNERVPDTPAWRDRRRIAAEWYSLLQGRIDSLPFDAVNMCAYENVGSNNADLPEMVTLVDTCSRGISLTWSPGHPLAGILAASSIVIAMTELSATAPLKNFARTMTFRGASMPGFTREMIPALELDYTSVDRRVQAIKSRMDRAVKAVVDLKAGGTVYTMTIDLRHRDGHASSGILRTPGTVGNLPSGEAYIVPYEGERKGVGSETSGMLPVQFGDEVVLFRVNGNRAVKVESAGPQSEFQRNKLEKEPAYGNIAELGIGVLGEWGVTSVGRTLLDEKLGLHIAFGRSDHFGGLTGPSAFRNAANVEHTDWVYVPSVQPRVTAHRVLFAYPRGEEEVVMDQGVITIAKPDDE